MPFDGTEFRLPATAVPTPWAAIFGRQAWRLARRCVVAGMGGLAVLFGGRPVARPEPWPAELLRMARALIEDEARWTQRFYETRDRRYCAVGALRAVARHRARLRTFEHADRVLQQVARQHGFRDMEHMNDGSTHAAVLAAFDAAIAAA